MRLPRAIKRPLIPVYNRWLAYKAAREWSVRNVALSNDRRAFETMTMIATPRNTVSV